MMPPPTTGAATPRSRSASGLGDDPADDDGRVDAAVAQRVEHDRDQLTVRAAEDREPDDVDALLQRARRDLRRREADALVDDVHADVARADGDLLGAVGVPVEARLADEDLQPAPERVAHALDLLAQRLEVLGREGRRGLADAGRRAELAERLAQGGGPLAGRRPRSGGFERRRHDVLVARGRRGELLERGVDGGPVTLGAPRDDRLALLRLERGVDCEDPAVGAL